MEKDTRRSEVFLIFVGAVAIIFGGILLTTPAPFENGFGFSVYVPGTVLIILGICAEIIIVYTSSSKIRKNQKEISDLRKEVERLKDELEKE